MIVSNSSSIKSIKFAKQGGALAASSGNTLENMVIAALGSKGLEILMYRQWDKNRQLYGQELLLKNVPYETIYGHKGNTEFLVLSQCYQVKTRIECKWQQANGSVDEKFPYLFANCVEKIQEPHVIILLDGGGAKAGAVDWLRRACINFTEQEKRSSNRIIELMNMSSFTRWVNKTFK